jgi:hypothetical protein
MDHAVVAGHGDQDPCLVQFATKWLAANDLFDGETLSEASLVFAAFIAMRPVDTLTSVDKDHIMELLNAKREAQGVPLMWDVILVKRGSV